VIGYIFEKYINDRADMGAYYTKEDITDYISKNCILPYLFDETERHYSDAFVPDSWIWTMLKESGDSYIYDAVKYGIPRDQESGKVKNWKHTENWWESPVFADLPDDVKEGLNPNQENLVEIREAWNTSAPNEVALPTEIWREVIERRKRYVEIRKTIENGEITTINDLITYNLNIRQFVQDVVMTTDDPKFILHFYKSMAGDGENRHPISVLDPTCGSGAFLFAALNILEPLYESCLQRMRSFVEDEDRLNTEDKEIFRHKYKFFREVLKDVQSDYHPNQEYFIYKSIILRNLYGVDIMREAVEIAKLRLFLKMVATVDVDTSKENLGLEPLPDIDFNIRSGNTLVGVGTEEEIDTLYDGFLDFDNTKEAVEEQCDMVSKAFNHYKQIQLTYGEDFESFKQAKKNLAERLADLRDKLDEMLKKRHYPGKDLEEWKESHQPFHWYAEFYDIIHDRGGFDVIIGNPPYVVYPRKVQYKLHDYITIDCKNLYAFVIERCKNISRLYYYGFIIPSSAFGTSSTESLRNLIENNSDELYIGYYSGDAHPSILFDGVKLRLAIVISSGREKGIATIRTTGYMRWYSDERDYVFEKIRYCKANKVLKDTYPKISNEVDIEIVEKISTSTKIENLLVNNSKYTTYYHNAPVFFIRAMNFIPYYKSKKSDRPSSNHFKELNTKSSNEGTYLLSLLNSSLFFFWFTNYSANRDLTLGDITSFPINKEMIKNEELINDLEELNQLLMKDLDDNSKIRTYNYSSGKVSYQEFYMRESKEIIDKIDTRLLEGYQLSNEAIDYLLNYDIKYRMGSELEDE
jgi:hypothetical protein